MRNAKRVWIWVVILTLLTCLWPVENRITRLALITGIIVIGSGALLLWWNKRGIRFTLLLLGVIPVLAVCLPGRDVNPNILEEDYVRNLRSFQGVHYVWGGEGFLGVDCSGLVRKGLFGGKLIYGVRTLNGRPIREAIELWWHDCSALALKDGYREWTSELARCNSITKMDHSLLRPGDLAVSADGVHILAYLGNQAWIEADPKENKVIEVGIPTNNPWFHIPVVFVRWKCLEITQPH